MSWSGPVTGAAPFQPPPYTTGSYGHQQTPHYGQHQNGFSYPQPGAPSQPPENRPPKKKGTPIITRYPPPPGYRGPAQPQGPFGTVQYQAQQGYAQSPVTPDSYSNRQYQGSTPTQAYPAQTYGPPQNTPHQQAFSQPSYQQAQSYQWPQHASQSYPSQSTVPQPSHYPNFSQQSAFQQYPNRPPSINTNQPGWPNTQNWSQPPGSATYPPTNQYNSFDAATNGQPVSDPGATPTLSSANPIISQPTPTDTQPPSATSETAPAEKPPLFLGWDEWDFDFDGAIWPKANEPVDPNLSLGVITWHPAKQVTRALPATFAEAEEQSLKPPAEKLGNGESVSLYFTAENSYEAFLDVRKTDEWYKIRNDPAFVVFTDEEMECNVVSLEKCLSLRDRPDEPVEESADHGDEEAHDSAWNVMDNLEQALSGDMEDIKRPARSYPSGTSSRDQAQEDILAKLGVTGSPKPPSEEPLSLSFPREEQWPASLPSKPPAPPSAGMPPRPDAPPQRGQSYSGHRNSTYGSATPRPYRSMFSATSHSLQPVPPQNGRTNSWGTDSQTQSQDNGQTSSDSRIIPSHADAGNGTAAASDSCIDKKINSVENDAPPAPQLKRNNSSFTRKRGYDDTDQEDEQARQQDDHSKRKRRSEVDAAYR